MIRATFRSAVIVATLFAIAGLWFGALAGPASAQSADDAAGIELTIRSQIEAMQVDDWSRAFEYASPTIQGVFRNPENFSRMVTNGYPMVWRPKTYRAGALVETPRGLSQTMIFEDRQGRLFIADYLMQRIDGEWRINGVSIRPSSEESV